MLIRFSLFLSVVFKNILVKIKLSVQEMLGVISLFSRLSFFSSDLQNGVKVTKF